MSADNYYFIRPDGDKYAVTMGFASDRYDTQDGGPPLQPHDPRFDTHDEAMAYADSEYSEYGVKEADAKGGKDETR